MPRTSATASSKRIHRAKSEHSAGRLVHLDLTTPGMTLLSVTRGASLQPDRVLPLYAGKVHVGQLSLAVRPVWRRSGEPTSDCSMLLAMYLPAVRTTSVYSRRCGRR